MAHEIDTKDQDLVTPLELSASVIDHALPEDADDCLLRGDAELAGLRVDTFCGQREEE